MFSKLIFTLIISINTLSFDYLEHSLVTDYACKKVLEKLEGKVKIDRKLLPSYLALILACPQNWDKKYCQGDYKTAQSYINILEDNDDYSFTLGDFSSLPDHIHSFGAIKGIPQYRSEGVLTSVLDWLLEKKGDADGIIEDVAEDACETDGKLDRWEHLAKDFDRYIDGNKIIFKYSHLDPSRSEILQGPKDPAGKYSFDNPQYLDLILNNHHHFGERAYQTWLGHHNLAIKLKNKSCKDLLVHEKKCSDFHKAISYKLGLWKSSNKKGFKNLDLSKDSLLIKETFISFLSLAIEGAGLHYIQDNYSGGHIRVRREAYNLREARHYHDQDGLVGVFSELRVKNNKIPFLSYGDGKLLGKGGGTRCPQNKINLTPNEKTNCLLEHQRSLISATTFASIFDWAYGGTIYPYSKNKKKDKVIENFLPTGRIAEANVEQQSPEYLSEGSLQTTPPKFSYQSISFSTAFSNSPSIIQTGIKLEFVDSLGDYSTWLTSYNYGLHTSSTDYSFEFSYSFHWRWAARFLLNGSPYFEYRRTKGPSRYTDFSIGPRLGISLLPEGWTHMPLQIDISYKAPFSFYKSQDREYEKRQFIEISIGLAFM